MTYDADFSDPLEYDPNDPIEQHSTRIEYRKGRQAFRDGKSKLSSPHMFGARLGEHWDAGYESLAKPSSQA